MAAQADEMTISPFPSSLRDLRTLCQPEHPCDPADRTLRDGAYQELGTVLQWLSGFTTSATERAYEKEAHRFYCWVLFVDRKLLAEITQSDLDSYEAFLRDPPDHWCGMRNRRRAAGDWRPFEGALSDSSCSFAFRVLESLFSFLVDFRHIQYNLFRERRLLRKKSATGPQKPSRSLSFLSFDRLIRELEPECAKFPVGHPAHEEAERMLFVILFMGNTGVRGEELARIRLSDLFYYKAPSLGDEKWSLSLRSARGQRARYIDLNPSAKYAVWRYLAARGVPLPPPPSPVPLVCRLHEERPVVPLGRDSIYGIVKRALNLVADKIEHKYPDEAARYRKASPHWLRVMYFRMNTDARQDVYAFPRKRA